MAFELPEPSLLGPPITAAAGGTGGVLFVCNATSSVLTVETGQLEPFTLGVAGSGAVHWAQLTYPAVTFTLHASYASGQSWSRAIVSNLPDGAPLTIWCFFNGFVLADQNGNAAQLSFSARFV